MKCLLNETVVYFHQNEAPPHMFCQSCNVHSINLQIEESEIARFEPIRSPQNLEELCERIADNDGLKNNYISD